MDIVDIRPTGEYDVAPLEPAQAHVPDVAAHTRINRWSRLVWGPWGDPRWIRVALLTIAAGAGVAYAWGISHDGLQLYYAAGVRSMSSSWRVFWFGGFDGAGQVSLDKLPGAFWVQALVVRVFGMSTPSLVIPQVVAGVLAVLALFRAVRQTAGPRAALVAAAVLATTPVTAMMSRGNTSDGLCVLLLVLAAGAALRAISTGRLRTLLLAALCVGLAFQAKMIEAWMVLPAFALAYLVAAPGSPWRRLAQLGVAGVVVTAISVSWMAAVALAPASQRPYVDGSQDNSIFEQVFVYNGMARFGAARGYGLGTDLPYSPSNQAKQYAADLTRSRSAPPADRSRPGWSRVVSGPVGGDVGWLLPTALCVLVGGLVALRRRPRTDPLRAGLLLWGGWLITYAVVFSSAATLMNYYLAMLSPAVAALCAIGVKLALDSRTGHWAMAIGLLASAVCPILLTSAALDWLPWAIGGLAVLAALLTALSRRAAALRTPGLVVGLAGVLLGPVTATVTLVKAGGGPFDAPFAAVGTLARPSLSRRAGPALPIYAGEIRQSTSTALWQHLDLVHAQMNDDLGGGKQKFVIFTAAAASSYVLAGVSGVVPVGGYTGLTDSPSVDQLHALIDSGVVRYAIVPGPRDLRANDPRVLLIRSSCRRSPAAILSGDESMTAAPQLYLCGDW